MADSVGSTIPGRVTTATTRELLFVIGTRPEAIKMAPVITAFRADPSFDVRVCVTAQHREMLDGALAAFDLRADFDLDVMEPGQRLDALTASVLTGVGALLERNRPDWLFVQGDTTTTFAASLAAFYARVPIAHIEAGLRSGDRNAPWPEETNRTLTAAVADIHFAPHEAARNNLLRENVRADRIHVTGNSVIDALLAMQERLRSDPSLRARAERAVPLDPARRLILVTGHRRESFGEGLEAICRGLLAIARTHPDVEIVYPVHLNPNVSGPVHRILQPDDALAGRIHLVAPVDYPTMVWLMSRAYLIVTDSGGIQEEAPSLGKPLLVTREKTERPEIVDAGAAMLVGVGEERLVAAASQLLADRTLYERMSAVRHLAGDGNASERIVAVMRQQRRPDER